MKGRPGGPPRFVGFGHGMRLLLDNVVVVVPNETSRHGVGACGRESSGGAGHPDGGSVPGHQDGCRSVAFDRVFDQVWFERDSGEAGGCPVRRSRPDIGRHGQWRDIQGHARPGANRDAQDFAAGEVEIMRKACSFARFWKCALQVNPHAYNEQYRGQEHGMDARAYAEALRDVCLEETIRVVGLADHGAVADAEVVRRVLTDAGIVVFPGFEVATTEKVHWVCLFSEDTTEQQLERYLGRLHLTDPEDGVRPSSLGGMSMAPTPGIPACWNSGSSPMP